MLGRARPLARDQGLEEPCGPAARQADEEAQARPVHRRRPGGQHWPLDVGRNLRAARRDPPAHAADLVAVHLVELHRALPVAPHLDARAGNVLSRAGAAATPPASGQHLLIREADRVGRHHARPMPHREVPGRPDGAPKQRSFGGGFAKDKVFLFMPKRLRARHPSMMETHRGDEVIHAALGALPNGVVAHKDPETPQLELRACHRHVPRERPQRGGRDGQAEAQLRHWDRVTSDDRVPVVMPVRQAPEDARHFRANACEPPA
mmetsp:Transcript_78214/g.226133  ORF Transcript_78214/g.226133 Transcript_78214/m.226133 type:complete len:263 (+) Transcript_78214:178-966(+)